jgi:hypothetical protein
MYRLNLQQIMHDSNIFNLTTVREQLKKDYNITDKSIEEIVGLISVSPIY